jgi:hypothetical protein
VKDPSRAGRHAGRYGDPVSTGCADRSQARSGTQIDSIRKMRCDRTNYFFASFE